MKKELLVAKKLNWTDHSRTTQQRSGEWFKNSRDLIGLFLLAAGAVGVPICLAAAAQGKTIWAIGAGIVAALAMFGGSMWLFIEGRRIRQVEVEWYSDRREQRSLGGTVSPGADGQILPA